MTRVDLLNVIGIELLGNPSASEPSPLLIETEKGQYFLKKRPTKNITIEQSMNAMLHEIFSWKIGKFLNVPLADCTILNVDEKILNNLRDLKWGYQLKKGFYFGSKKLNAAKSNLHKNHKDMKEFGLNYLIQPWEIFLSDIENTEDLAKIIAFDFLTLNLNRFEDYGNIIVAYPDDLSKTIYAIDNGDSFNGSQQSPLDRLISLRNYNNISDELINEHVNQYLQCSSEKGFYGILGEYIPGLQKIEGFNEKLIASFISIVDEMEKITEAHIVGWLLDIPDDWYTDKDAQVEFYKNFLLYNIKNMRKYIESLLSIGIFPGLSVNDLQWKQTQII